MAEPTDADRTTAARYWLQAQYDLDSDPEELIAQALADQRAAADDGLRGRVEELVGEVRLAHKYARHRAVGDPGIVRDQYVGRTWALGDVLVNLLETLDPEPLGGEQ